MNQPGELLEERSDSRPIPSLAEVVSDVSALVTPPTVCVKMYELVRSERATAREIGDVVALDPNLTGRLLKIVNSAYFGFNSSIDTIERAVTAIGVRDLYNLVLAITAVRSFSGLNTGLVSMEAFWRHSVLCALVSRELAKYLRLPGPERFFVTGLLHDVGLLVMYSQLDEHVAPMREVLERKQRSLHTEEIERFKFSHACVGAEILTQWELPQNMRSAVRFHHAPTDGSPVSQEAALIQVADRLASGDAANTLAHDPACATSASALSMRALGLDADTFDGTEILAAAQDAFGQSMRNLLP